MSVKLFITGTDTDIGKTYISTGLLRAFNQRGLTSLGLKPVASGCFKDASHLYNADALALQHTSTIKLPYHHINPFAFEKAIAPHIAAKETHVNLTLEQLTIAMHPAFQVAADICIIEGAGGWYTPLNVTETMADFAIHHQLHTIMVVGVRLGCINHARLTEQALQLSGLPIVGWIANCVTADTPYALEQIATLKECLSTAYLGTVQYQESPENVLNIDKILSPH